MLWGEYLCYGVNCNHRKTGDGGEGDLVRLTGRLEQALCYLGLSKFSSSVAVQFVTSRLQHPDGQRKMAHVLQFLLNLLNSKGGTADADPERNACKYKCPQLIPGLRGSPFWQPEDLSWIKGLEESFVDIRKEFFAMKQLKSVSIPLSGFQHYRSPKPQDNSGTANDGSATELASMTASAAEDLNSLGESATDKGQWNVCYFYLHGVDFSANLQLCPLTQAAIDAVPRQYHHSLFSALAPDTHVKPHCGPTNKKLRCHLPLYVPGAPHAGQGDAERAPLTATPPSTPWLRVGSQYCALQEGKCVVFDDSFEHEACNPSLTEPRVVLIIDFWHPDLSDEEVKFFEFINKAQIQAAKRISSAMASNTSNIHSSSSSSSDSAGSSAQKEDFFHVIQAAKEVGIQESDYSNIWSEQQLIV